MLKFKFWARAIHSVSRPDFSRFSFEEYESKIKKKKKRIFSQAFVLEELVEKREGEKKIALGVVSEESYPVIWHFITEFR